MNATARHSLHRPRPLSVQILGLAIGITLLSLLLPLMGLPDWLPLLGAGVSAALVYWVLNNPAEEFLVVQQGQLQFKAVNSRRLEALALDKIVSIQPQQTLKHTQLNLQCRDGSKVCFQAYYGNANDDELRQLDHFLRQHLSQPPR
ncbi:hypothetical protein [Gallaecimonas xiamenensis]|uniref:PH domain-containing protein n=1 Tax=Gallaecimonas xiamenensis 3-C-1 TaxID=745411 RepID=K2J311_9GAMM|nr:hypothetical protein [Gallaecimonas xiamenensis]EKE69227.1 hypothetical protein B3C1_15532 [Gallaecimonas xiamenensis 3-C-1]